MISSRVMISFERREGNKEGSSVAMTSFLLKTLMPKPYISMLSASEYNILIAFALSASCSVQRGLRMMRSGCRFLLSRPGHRSPCKRPCHLSPYSASNLSITICTASSVMGAPQEGQKFPSFTKREIANASYPHFEHLTTAK